MPTDSGRHVVDLLARLGREYRHFQQEHVREGRSGAIRHGLGSKMQRLANQFGRLLSHWVQDEDLRQAWTRYLFEGGVPPDEPRVKAPPVFRGLTEAGSVVEVRACEDRGYDLIVDGAIRSHDAIPWSSEPDLIEPIQIGEHLCREITEAPAEALRELVTFLDTPGAEPPWRWLPTLFEDGLVDANFGLTVRGYRRIGKAGVRALESPPPVTFGVLAADAARARLFVLHTSGGQDVPTIGPLIEVSETTHPDQRARDSEVFSDTRPGLQRGGPRGPRHAVSDRREGQRRDALRRFAAQIAREAGQIWRSYGATRIIVVASPAMLGALRSALARTDSRPNPWSSRELARDLTPLAAAALHDVLAADGLLPARARLPPLRSSPGRPIA